VTNAEFAAWIKIEDNYTSIHFQIKSALLSYSVMSLNFLMPCKEKLNEYYVE